MLLFAKARPSQARGIAKVLEEFWVMLVLKVLKGESPMIILVSWLIEFIPNYMLGRVGC